MLQTYAGGKNKGKLELEGRFALGFALQFLDRTEDAVKSYRKVVGATRAVVAARAQYHIGECFMDSGEHRKAAREFLTVAVNFDFDGGYRSWTVAGYDIVIEE